MSVFALVRRVARFYHLACRPVTSVGPRHATMRHGRVAEYGRRAGFRFLCPQDDEFSSPCFAGNGPAALPPAVASGPSRGGGRPEAGHFGGEAGGAQEVQAPIHEVASSGGSVHAFQAEAEVQRGEVGPGRRLGDVPPSSKPRSSKRSQSLKFGSEPSGGPVTVHTPSAVSNDSALARHLDQVDERSEALDAQSLAYEMKISTSSSANGVRSSRRGSQPAERREFGPPLPMVPVGVCPEPSHVW